jgi:hypothetical protein
MATFVPALLEIAGKLVHLCWLTVAPLSFRKLSAPQPTPNRFPPHPRGTAEICLRLARVRQSEDFLIALRKRR